MVVCAKNEGQVFQANDHDQRPEHQGKDSQDVGMTAAYMPWRYSGVRLLFLSTRYVFLIRL